MALPGPEGNRRRSLFPRLFPKAFTRAFTRFFSRLLRGLRERTTSGRQTARDQLLSSDLIFLSNASNGLSLECGSVVLAMVMLPLKARIMAVSAMRDKPAADLARSLFVS